MSTEVFEDEMNMHVICVFVLSFLYSTTMPKITISSTRVYYKELSLDDALTVHLFSVIEEANEQTYRQ